MYVYHTDDETVHDVIDGVLHSIPSRTPYEFTSDFIGRKFMEHKHMHGVVQLQTNRTRQGLLFDIEQAEVESTKQLLAAETAVIESYISGQLEDRMAHGKPAVPPGGRQVKLIKKHQVDLASHGIVPVGTAKPISPEIALVLEQNRQMMALIAQLLGAKVPVESALEAGEGRVIPLATVVNTPPVIPLPTANQNVAPIRGPEQPFSPNPTAEDLGARVVDGDAQLVEVGDEAEDPNTVSGPSAPAPDEPGEDEAVTEAPAALRQARRRR